MAQVVMQLQAQFQRMIRLIAAEAKKLNALKTFKKGLMQQLFPPPEGD